MYEDYTLEEKYLHNFSTKEKACFYHQHKKRVQSMAEYEGKLHELIFLDSPAIFGNSEPSPTSSLEIKYILNRIAANDPRDTSFELGEMDSVPHPDRLALDIAKSFRDNTICKQIILNGIGLTDNGIIPILHTLKTKELDLLDIRNNKLTAPSIQVLETILSNPETKWQKVNLGRVPVLAEQRKSLEMHKNLSFIPIQPTPTIRQFFQNLRHR